MISGNIATGLMASRSIPFVTDGRLNVDFDRTDPTRLPFRVQVLDPKSLPLMVGALREAIRTYRLDWLITDCFFPAPLAARLEGINFGVVLNGPAWLLSGHELWSADLSNEERWLADFSERMDLPSPADMPLLPGVLAGGRFISCIGAPSMADRLPSPSCLDVSSVRFVGWPMCNTWSPSPNGSDLDLIVTMGSLPVDGSTVCEVLRPLRDCGLRVGLTAPTLPPGFDWVTAVGFKPSLRELLSPNMVVLHHGGISSTLETIWAGCPAVVFPLHRNTDQPINGFLVSGLNVGRLAESTDALSICVNEVVNDAGIRTDTQRVSAELHCTTSENENWLCDAVYDDGV